MKTQVSLGMKNPFRVMFLVVLKGKRNLYNTDNLKAPEHEISISNHLPALLSPFQNTRRAEKNAEDYLMRDEPTGKSL